MNSTVSVKVVKAKPVVVPPPTYKLTLELTYRDAVALRTLTGHIAGSSENSVRKLTSEIWSALSKAGVPVDEKVLVVGDNRITFNNYDTNS